MQIMQGELFIFDEFAENSNCFELERTHILNHSNIKTLDKISYYCIRTNRTPRDPFWAHCGQFCQKTFENAAISLKCLAKNDHSAQSKNPRF